MSTQPSKELETFPNPRPGREYEIHFECPEFTCLCPKTGQPDFAHIDIVYVPDELCVELKSLKLYLWSFRDEGHFHEAVTEGGAQVLLAASVFHYRLLSIRQVKEFLREKGLEVVL